MPPHPSLPSHISQSGFIFCTHLTLLRTGPPVIQSLSSIALPGAGLDMLPRYADAGASRQRGPARRLLEPRRAAAHDLSLAHELGVEFRSVQREVDVKVHAVERALRRVHPLKVLLEVLAREI